jgi:S-adenosylmethionine decarboxylase
MKALGCHIVAELSLCDPELLAELEGVKSAMVEAAEVANAEVREVAFHRFIPHGVSGVVVIAESHLSIHTWPEIGYAAVDIYTCGSHTDPMKALQHLSSKLLCKQMTTTTIARGYLTGQGSFGHRVTDSQFQEEPVAVQGV